MKITKHAENLLASVFTRNGVVFCSGTHSSHGTLPLWGQLVIAGLVSPMPTASPFGHPYSYELTDAGKAFLGGMYSPYDLPYWCRTCHNTFKNEGELIEHRTRKHSHIVNVLPLYHA